MVNVLYANDRPGEYPQSWYAATAAPLPPFQTLQGEVKADVCIIGGGYSGLSAALHLKKKGYDVALVDAHRVGWGASGRNGGQLGSGQRLEQGALIKLVGRDHAASLWRLSEEAKALVKALIAEHAIDCGFVPGVIHANHKPGWTDDTKAEIDLLQSEYGYEAARYLPQEELRALLATTAYYDGSFDTDAGHLHPLRFALGLAKACDEAGVRIFERSEAGAIEHGGAPVVRTREGVIRARWLVLAANGYLGGLEKSVAKRVMPINNYILATEQLDEALATSLIANNAAVADSKFVINYYRLSEDRRLLFGGRESYRYRFPADIKGYVQRAMLKIYPQLEGVRIDYGWGGTLAITMNRMPYFDWVAPNALTVCGYSGHGLGMATLGGALAAEAISGVAERFDVMQAVPTPQIPGGPAARLPLLALAMAFYSMRDRL